MNRPHSEQIVLIRAGRIGGLVGFVLGVVYGVHWISYLYLAFFAVVGIFAGRALFRGIAVLFWSVFGGPPSDPATDCDQQPPAH